MNPLRKTRLLPALALLFLIGGAGRADSAVELRFIPLEGELGEAADYPVKFVVEGLSTGSALQFDLTWDPRIVGPISPALDADATNHLLEYEQIGDHQLRVLVYSLTNAEISIEGLMTIGAEFKLDSTTEAQPFSVENLLLSDADSQSVEIVGKPLVFEIPKDIDGAFTPAKDDVALQWAESAGAISYEVFRGTTDNLMTASLHGLPNDTSFLDDFVGNTVYYYWISATYEDGKSSISPALRVAPVPSKPGQFIVTSATHPSDTSLAWTLLDSPDSLAILRSIGSSIEGAKMIAEPGTDENGFVDASAVSGIPYFYWLKITNAHGSTYTEAEQGLSAISPVFEDTRLKALMEDKDVNLSWSTVDGNDYAIAYSNDMKSWTLLPNTIPGTGSPVLWDAIQESGLEYPVFFQVFSVKE